jgi:hypothetical protein
MRLRVVSVAQLPLVCALLFIAVVAKAIASEPSRQVSSTVIEQSVISLLPKANGNRAEVVEDLDLTRLFETRTPWAFVAALLPGTHFDGAEPGPIEGGPLAECFVDGSTPHCTYPPTNDVNDFSTPIEFYSAKAVFRGANSTHPLLMIQTGSAHGGNGGHLILTELLTYDRRLNEFQSVFYNATGSNNNQRTNFIEEGPLRGDVIVAEPAGCCYSIEVYRLGASGHYVSILGYQGRTVYGDRNPLSVSDSEMPEILRRLGLWRKGDPLPIPHDGCTPVMRRGEEWCQSP